MPRRKRIPNALLARPPKGVHELEVAGGEFFRRMIGRPPRAEDYYGVHATGNPAIAGVYAMGATREARQEHPDAYPVIVVLDVHGLKALPDVDAMAQSQSILGDQFVRRELQGHDLQDASDSFETQYTFGTRSDVADAIVNYYVYDADFTQAFHALEDGDEQWEHWLATGEWGPDVSTALVDQRRYMHDFDLRRLVRIDAMQEWWPVLVDEDPFEGTEAADIEERGYKTVTVEDLFYGQELTLKTVAEGRGKDRDVQYHGTSSWHAQRAFPELRLPPNPFPIQEREDNPKRKLKNRLMR